MEKVKKIKPRGQVKTQDTWDLTKLFKSDAAWEKSFKKLNNQIVGFKKFKGTLSKSASALAACLTFEMEFDKLAEKLSSYAFLKSSQNVGDSTYQEMLARYTNVATSAMETASFISPEIQAISKRKLLEFLKSPSLKIFKFQLEQLLRYKNHILSPKEERLLAMQGEVAGTASRIFDQLNDADLKFGFVKDENKTKVELTQSSYSTLLESPLRSVRKTTATQYYKVYSQHSNTLAATYSSSVLQDIYLAKARNHKSSLEASLYSDNVPKKVYDNLISAVHKNIEINYRYLELRRKALKLKQLHFYDTYVPIVQTARVKTPYNKAVKTIIDAVAPLGKSYCNTLKKGLTDRWVDKYENLGKRSGAFSAGGFSGPPYILMNYQNSSISSVFTLAHEAGHSMHTYYSALNQPYPDYDYTIFVAEVASTFNEQLLTKHLMSKARDKKTRAYLLNREIGQIRATLIRQTMFAEFEKITHQIAESGEGLTLQRLRDEYKKLLKFYFGPQFAIDDYLDLEWARIPHFYSAFYVYKYATGLAAAITLCDLVVNGGKKEQRDYLNFLSSGGSRYPLDLLRAAGVDLEKPAPVNNAMERLGHLIDELETLI